MSSLENQLLISLTTQQTKDFIIYTIILLCNSTINSTDVVVTVLPSYFIRFEFFFQTTYQTLIYFKTLLMNTLSLGFTQMKMEGFQMMNR